MVINVVLNPRKVKNKCGPEFINKEKLGKNIRIKISKHNTKEN